MRLRKLLAAAVYLAAACFIALVAMKVSLNAEHRAQAGARPSEPDTQRVAALAKTGLGMSPAAVDRSLLFRASEMVRHGVLGMTVPAWLVLVLVGAYAGHDRSALARWLRVLAVVAALAWLLDPGYAFTWEGMTANRFLAAGIAMVVFSLAFSRVPSAPNKPAHENA